MKRKGYRNCTEEFGIDSYFGQFNFDKSHKFLKVKLCIPFLVELAPIERVNIYLKDHYCLQNVFIVDKNLFYYYQASWYYNYNSDPREEAPIPPHNICDEFNFNIEDILIIEASNNPLPAKWDICYLLMPFKPDRLDTKKSIEKNIFIKELRWNKLPDYNADIIYTS